MLTSMKLDIQRINRRSPDPEIKAIVADLLNLVQEIIGAVRSISEDLRPGVQFDLELSQARATAIYRIFQEALTNIARHAQATAVEVRLAADQGRLTLEVLDNGRGISAAGQSGKSIGLVSMAERARELGGTLTVGDGPAGGTLLILQVPVEDQP